MSADAIVVMLVAMALLWGGLAVAIVNLIRRGTVPTEEAAKPPIPEAKE